MFINLFEKSVQENREKIAIVDKMLAGLEVDSNIIFDKEENQDMNEQLQANITMNLGAELGQSEIYSFLKEQGLTANTFFLGGYSYALAKFTGQEESLLCTVSDEILHQNLENTRGILVKKLPLYIKIDEEGEIYDYLIKLQHDVYNRIKHQDYSFEKIVKDHDVKKDIFFVYLDEKVVPLENIKTDSRMANLSLMVFKKNNGYELSLNYRGDLYFESTMKRFMDMFVMILKGFTTKLHLKEIPLISEKDRALRETFNYNDLEFNQSLTVIDLFKEQVERVPNNTAIVFQDKHMSYKELDDLSEALAIYLKKKGIKAEKSIGILIKRSDVFPVCFLGVLKAGGAYQPLDPKQPKARLTYMMEDTKMDILILDEDLQELVSEFEGEIIYTKDIYSLPLDLKVELGRPSPEDLFNILYTSGSTELPKGCMLEHKNIINFCKGFQKTYNLTEQSRSVGYASFGFDAAILDFFPSLTIGASIYILPEEMRLDLPRLDDYFRENKITNVFLTTQLGRQYISEYPDNPYIKTFLTGGERLITCDPPNYPFENVYGPTECTIIVTHFAMDKKFENIPIGRSMNNSDTYIVDKYNRELPIMVPGELCIAGFSVSRGYLNKEDQTKKVFVPNPFSKKKGYERIYKTGDICRYLEDGNIEFVGRRDSQLKIKGFHIELSEIESRIRQFSKVKNATVIAKEAANGDKFIVAYITGEDEIEIPKLNDFIMEELPYYMVPAVTIQIDRIPVNQNGKVDKGKLPEDFEPK